MNGRLVCQEKRWKDGEPCKNPARFVVNAPAYKDEHFLVCGVHAGGFIATALYPFRLKDWQKNEQPRKKNR